ncbi:MAG: poly(ADP-ribose) glycohydrolase, partial [archaeon]|nr:poly(ADP-ribose) glycohydrolase [archaeon]
QEEILFAIKPECSVAMLLMEYMSNDEAIIIYNARRYSYYTGYKTTFRFKYSGMNSVIIPEILDEKKNEKGKFIIAIDSIKDKDDISLTTKGIIRDIHKAYVGFNFDSINKNIPKDKRIIATGNWGCGAFNCDFELKFLEQWIAATFAGAKRIEYSTFGADKMKVIVKHYKDIKNKFKTGIELFEALTGKYPIKREQVVKALLSK